MLELKDIHIHRYLTSLIGTRDYGEINPLLYLVGSYKIMKDNFKDLAGVDEEEAVKLFIRTFEEVDYPSTQTEVVFVNLVRGYKIDVNKLYTFLKNKINEEAEQKWQ